MEYSLILHVIDTLSYCTQFVDWKRWRPMISDCLSFLNLQWLPFFLFQRPSSCFFDVLPDTVNCVCVSVCVFGLINFLYERTIKQYSCLQYLFIHVLSKWVLYRIVMSVDKEGSGQ